MYERRNPALAVVRQRFDHEIRLRRQLQESEEMFRSAFQLSPVSMAIVAPTGSFLHANGRCCQLLGYTVQDLSLLSLQEVVYPNEGEAFSLLDVRHLTGARSGYRGYQRFLRQDGQILWGDWTVTVRRTVEGDPDYLLLSIVEVSAPVQAPREDSEWQSDRY